MSVSLVLAVTALAAASLPARAQQPAARHKPGPKTIRGVARKVHGHEFVLQTTSHGSFQVLLSAATTVVKKGAHGRVSISNGEHVGVRGFVSGDHIRAISVRVYPTKPKPYSIRGVVTGIQGNILIIVGGGQTTRARVDGGTVIRINRSAGSLAQIRRGDKVEVRVQPGSGGPVALHIHVFSHRPAGRHVQVRGTVASHAGGSVVVNSGGRRYRVRITSQTTVYVGRSRGNTRSLRPGAAVTVYACCAGHSLTATSIHVRTVAAKRQTVVVKGLVGSVSENRLQIVTTHGTVQIVLGAATRFEIGHSPMGRSGIRVGDQVSIHAYRASGGLVAGRVHVYAASRRPHTITGVVVSVSGSGIVIQARGKRYLIRASSGTTVSLNGKVASRNSIRTGDHIHAVGRLSGATLAADRIIVKRVPPRLVTVRGTVTGIHGKTLTVVDTNGAHRTVTLAPGAHVRMQGKPAPPLALFPGVRVSARGHLSGRTLLATTVTLTVKNRTAKGRIVRVTSSRLQISLSSGGAATADLPAGAKLMDASRRIGTGGLQSSAFVEITGYAEPSGRIRAVAVTVLHPVLDLSGVVVSSSGILVITSSRRERYRVRVTAATHLTTGQEKVNLGPSEIPIGAHIHVHGKARSDGSIMADTAAVRLKTETLRGTVSAIDQDRMTVQAASGVISIRLSGATTFFQGSHVLSIADVVVGDDVTVYGYEGGPQTVLARKLLVHRRLVGLDGMVASTTSDGFILTATDGNHRVIVSPSTLISGASTAVSVGLSVHVTGYRRGDGVILATRLRLGKKKAAYTVDSEHLLTRVGGPLRERVSTEPVNRRRFGNSCAHWMGRCGGGSARRHDLYQSSAGCSSHGRGMTPTAFWRISDPRKRHCPYGTNAQL